MGGTDDGARFLHYPGRVSRPPRTSSIPAAALAREARLEAILEAMAAAPSQAPAPLVGFLAALQQGRMSEAEASVPGLARQGLVEEAFLGFRELRRALPEGPGLQTLATSLAKEAEAARARRESSWNLDSSRTIARFTYAKREPALLFDTGDLHRVFLAAMRLEGLPLGLDLGHHPKPMLQLGPPLPAEVGGEAEWGEAVFRRSPGEATHVLGKMASRLPPGISLLQWQEAPPHATPVVELAETSEWAWECPPGQLEAARARVGIFLEADRFPWVRAAKQSGPEEGRAVNLRPMVVSMAWEGSRLVFSTPMAILGATNPLKMLGAILDQPADAIRGLVRRSIGLRADPRLAHGDRFAPKLRNLYEDAVLLSGGSNITLIEDEDDEPMRLG